MRFPGAEQVHSYLRLPVPVPHSERNTSLNWDNAWLNCWTSQLATHSLKLCLLNKHNFNFDQCQSHFSPNTKWHWVALEWLWSTIKLKTLTSRSLLVNPIHCLSPFHPSAVGTENSDRAGIFEPFSNYLLSTFRWQKIKENTGKDCSDYLNAIFLKLFFHPLWLIQNKKGELRLDLWTCDLDISKSSH